MTSIFLLLLVMGYGFYSAVASGNDDLITNLPGEPSELSFAQYAGRIDLDNNGSHALFYWLMEATKNQLSKPLILWLNGGPGCSSLAGGAFQEIGPFRVQEDGTTLTINPSSWNSESNLLFLEIPAGVGFSLLQKSQVQGDNTTAEDAYAFLLKWLSHFPQYESRDFYLAGESYAGHYIPQLAQVILKRNHPSINLKGILLGNPTLDAENDYGGQFQYWWSLGLISDSTKNMLEHNCPFESFLHPGPSCKTTVDKAKAEIGPIDPNNIFTTPCNDDMGETARGFGDAGLCFLNRTKKYLNNLDVQKAIHADLNGGLYPWRACNSSIYNLWSDSPSSVLSIIKELIDAGLRVWVFSGNADASIPVTSTRKSLKALNLTVLEKWYPWIDGNGQVGGWTEMYDGLNYVIIRGAGHQPPLDRPEQSLLMLKKFLENQAMPADKNPNPPPL